MKKTLSIFALAGITLVSACGPSAEELAKKEQATKDSIAAIEKARQDSLDEVMKAQMTADSISQAEAAALADSDAEKNSKSTPNKPAGKKDEPKKEEPKKEDPKRPARDGLNNSGNNSGNETKPAGERPKRGGMNPKVN
jgi:hypothetical protein